MFHTYSCCNNALLLNSWLNNVLTGLQFVKMDWFYFSNPILKQCNRIRRDKEPLATIYQIVQLPQIYAKPSIYGHVLSQCRYAHVIPWMWIIFAEWCNDKQLFSIGEEYLRIKNIWKTYYISLCFPFPIRLNWFQIEGRACNWSRQTFVSRYQLGAQSRINWYLDMTPVGTCMGQQMHTGRYAVMSNVRGVCVFTLSWCK